jgi:hypothetical protein
VYSKSSPLTRDTDDQFAASRKQKAMIKSLIRPRKLESLRHKWKVITYLGAEPALKICYLLFLTGRHIIFKLSSKLLGKLLSLTYHLIVIPCL